MGFLLVFNERFFLIKTMILGFFYLFVILCIWKIWSMAFALRKKKIQHTMAKIKSPKHFPNKWVNFFIWSWYWKFQCWRRKLRELLSRDLVNQKFLSSTLNRRKKKLERLSQLQEKVGESEGWLLDGGVMVTNDTGYSEWADLQRKIEPPDRSAHFAK